MGLGADLEREASSFWYPEAFGVLREDAFPVEVPRLVGSKTRSDAGMSGTEGFEVSLTPVDDGRVKTFGICGGLFCYLRSELRPGHAVP